MSKGAAWTLDEYERDVLGEAQRVSPLRPAAKADGSASLIVAKPFAWPDPATIPRREFLFGRHYIRKAIGATIAGGARAKTTLSHIEAVSMACGRILLTGERITPLRVWCVNGEEDQDEIDRRIAAVCKRYGITEADCGDRLFVQSVRENPLRFAAMVHGAPTLNHAALKQFEAEISEAAGVRLLTRNGHDFAGRFTGRRGGGGVTGALLPYRRRGDRHRPERTCGVRSYPRAAV
jgi:AAA domain